MLAGLRKPHINLGTFTLRLGLAAILLFDGYLKLAQGGGTGWEPELSQGMQVTLAWTEFVSGISLLLGFLSRVAAGLLILEVVGLAWSLSRMRSAISASLGKTTFDAQTIGAEYNLAILTLALGIFFLGSGKYSLDYYFFWRKKPGEV